MNRDTAGPLEPDGTRPEPTDSTAGQTEVNTSASESMVNFLPGVRLGLNKDAKSLGEGSAWERLSLVNAQVTHPGRWLLGAVGLATVFVLAFGVAMAALWHQSPHREKLSTASKPKTPLVNRPAMSRHKPLEQAAQSTKFSFDAHGQDTPALITSAQAASDVIPSPSPTSATLTTDLPPVSSVEGTPKPNAAEPAIVDTTSPLANTQDKWVSLKIDSVPTGAQIQSDGRLLGTTPCETRLPAGDHQLIARYRDWPETRQTIHVDNNRPVDEARPRSRRGDPAFSGAYPSDAICPANFQSASHEHQRHC